MANDHNGQTKYATAFFPPFLRALLPHVAEFSQIGDSLTAFWRNLGNPVFCLQIFQPPGQVQHVGGDQEGRGRVLQRGLLCSSHGEVMTTTAVQECKWWSLLSALLLPAVYFVSPQLAAAAPIMFAIPEHTYVPLFPTVPMYLHTYTHSYVVVSHSIPS